MRPEKTFACAALACSLLAAGGASASDAEAARALAQKGTEAYRQGRFQEAKQAYSHAYDLDPKPPLLFDIAQCARNERDYAGAASFYRLYLESYPPHQAPNDAMVHDLLAEMQAHSSDGGNQAAAPEPSLVRPAPRTVAPPVLVPRPEVAPPPPPLIPAAAPMPTGTTASAQAGEEPLYKKWWLWAGVGVVAAGIGITAVALNEPQPRGASLGSANLRGGQ
jgi:tetratricopeptide (TPR) repeat protein